MSAEARAAHDRRQRQVLVGIALMFFAPLAVCFYLYYGHADWHPEGRVNRGVLIDPPRPLPALSLPRSGGGNDTRPNFLKGKWTFLYVSSGTCADACLKRLYDTRQVRIALDRDMNRVQRVLIAGADCCDARFIQEQHPDLITVPAGDATRPVLALLPEQRTSAAAAVAGAGAVAAADAARSGAIVMPAAPAGDARVYVVDPLGNLMMFYPPEAKAKGILEDMKRLLRLSSIG